MNKPEDTGRQDDLSQWRKHLAEQTIKTSGKRIQDELSQHRDKHVALIKSAGVFVLTLWGLTLEPPIIILFCLIYAAFFWASKGLFNQIKDSETRILFRLVFALLSTIGSISIIPIILWILGDSGCVP